MYEVCARAARSCSSVINDCGGVPPSVCAYSKFTARCFTVIGTTRTSTGFGSQASAVHSALSIDLAGDGGWPTYVVPASCADCSADAPPSGSEISSIGLGG